MTPASPRKHLLRYAATDLTGLAFAAIWASRGLSALSVSPSYSLAAIGIISAPLAWGFLTRDLALARPEIVIDHALAKRARRARIILLFLAGTITGMLHRPNLMIIAAGMIIGGSYLPLGRAMNEPVHLATGMAIMIITLGSLPLPPPYHLAVAGLGTALSCWLGAVMRLLRSTYPTDLPDRTSLEESTGVETMTSPGRAAP
ncbi:hypothetical protein C0V97_11815 [Asaia sp. W19]|uniref:hypothetical protein n=1 Tax=unclassified Asaia TaxID=2685023 RepID=UPI000F8D8306|nr:hypothetical protein [Asaia sp. W19]RUT25275.1 hypothetical protein C0V97_11815 [Asaia sp. W19]